MSTAPSPLTAALREEITRQGPIPFRRFMARALYDPHHGYYGAARARVGRAGDFFTTVSVGPLFGQLLARQFAEMWERLDRPAEFAIVEQGAHEGDFAADVLRALEQYSPDCLAATIYWIVEPLPALQARQRTKLAAHAEGRVRWADSLAALPPFTGVHFSNELPDAFPVHRIVRRGDQWLERGVDWRDDRFVFVDLPLSTPALREAVERLPAVAPDYETEINLEARGWIAEVASRLQRGFVLVIDYGWSRAEYYRPERTSGSLSAYADHRRENDPLARPGEIDLTAHVDFTSLAEAALAAGFTLAGSTDQHHFMVGLGQSYFTDEAPPAHELRAFKTLMHPSLMGHSFHALALVKGLPNTRLTGFQFSSDPHRLLC